MITMGLYSQWNPLQWWPPWKCEYFVKPTPVVFFQTVAFIRRNQNSDGDRFDNIFSAHVLELGRNIEQGIVTVDNNVWIFTTMCLRVCIDGLSMSERVGCLTFCGSKTRMERAIRNLLWSQWRYHLQDMCAFVWVWQLLNNSCKASPSLG